MNVTINIPFCNKKPCTGSDFDLDKVTKQHEAYSWDLLGSFSKRLIASLERRMKACQENLIRHLDDVEYSDECGHIVYVRKDGTRGSFNVHSFNAMKDAIKALQQSCWRSYLNNSFWIDQTLKALLNDPEQDHSDQDKFKYSELVSLLCEAHAFTEGRTK